MLQVKIEAKGFEIQEPIEDVGFTLSVSEQYLEAAEEIADRIGGALAELSGEARHGVVHIYTHDPKRSEPWKLVATTAGDV